MSHNYVSLIKDENNDRYYIHDNRFVDGLVDDTTISLLSKEEINKNYSGVLCFYWNNYTVSGNTATFTVCDSSGTSYPLDYRLIEPGDIISVLSKDENGYEANYCGKVLSKSGSNLTCQYELDLPSTFDPSQGVYSSGHPGKLWFPEKPDIGIISFGQGSVSLGENNKANGKFSFSVGELNISDGTHSTTIGYENIAGCDGVAIGSNNEVYGHNSIAIGNDNKIYFKNSFVIGNNLTCNADGQIVFGNGINLPSSADNYSYAFMIGRTSGNPLMITTNGDVFARGEIFVKRVGNSASTTGGYKLNGVRTSTSRMYLIGTTINTLPAASTTVENFANSQVYATDGVLNAKSLTSAQQYITVGNIKVWVSKTAPTDGVSDGDIGIGW